MLVKSSKPAVERLIDTENIDTGYVFYTTACKMLGIGTTALKFYVTCYEFGKNKFCKKEDIERLINLKNRFDKTINLCPILDIVDPKSVKSFLEKYEIRYLPNGTHPFGSCHLYYKEDLELIKEKRIQHKEYIKSQHANLHKSSGAYKNRVNTALKYRKHLVNVIEIDLIKIEEYYTIEEVFEIFKNGGFKFSISSNCIKAYVYNKKVYYKKSDVLAWSEKMKDVIKLADLQERFGYSSSDALVKRLQKDNISCLKPNEHPYGYFTITFKQDIEKFNSIVEEREINLEEYITYKDIIALLGVKTPAASIERFTEAPIYIKSIKYYKKKDIDKLHKCLTDTVPLLDLEKKYAHMIGDRALRSLIEANNIKLIIPNEHPFTAGILVHKDSLERIDNLVNIKYKVDTAKSRKEKFDILISQIPQKEAIKETLEDFTNEFVYKMLNSSQDSSRHLTLYRVYALLCDMLKRNLHEYSREEVTKIIGMVFNDERNTRNVKIMFVQFCNFSQKKYNHSVSEPYKINLKQLTKTPRDKTAYSKEQLLELFGLVYCSLDDKECLNKALDNRNYAMIWLYMYMHFVVFWRRTTITEMPKPNLGIIGFECGEDFINWCKEPTNLFTVEMGMKICASVKIQIDSLAITASKNDKPLVFEHGKLMSRGLGLLLALCEAHRQISEDVLKQVKLKQRTGFGIVKDAERLITSNFNNIQHFIGLFGKKYTDILGDETFSNLRAEKAFNNYTLDYSEENNNAIGTHLLSIMRSHVVDIKGVSNTTPTYETRVEEGTIGDIIATLEEIGSFGFAQHTLLTICDSEYKTATLTEKNKKILDLSITPSQAESIVKSVYIQRETVTKLLTKMITNHQIAKNVLEGLAYGNVAAKHHNSRCLLKAMLNAHVDNVVEEIQALELGTDDEPIKNCLMPAADNCFSCPLLIGQLYLLYELNELISDSINKIKSTENHFERLLQSRLIFNSYMPILYEAQDVFGEDIVASYINVSHIYNSLNQLESEGKILLE